MSDGQAASGGIRARVAAAPISWGVCEVPGWGYQLAPEQVLAEMSDLGFTATEFGPDGFLLDEPQAKADQLASYGLSAVGGFLPILLHDKGHDPMPDVDAFIDACLASGAGVVVLAAATGSDGYDARPVLDDDEWTCLLANLDRIDERATQRGVVASLHPHIGTLVENAEEVDRVMAGSQIGLCVDTGHLAAAGADPVAITQTYVGRVRHVHLKDVDLAMAKQVVAGDAGFGEAVHDGMWRRLGDGDVDIATMVRTLEGAGYSGWYVLEQDVMLDDAAAGAGVQHDVQACRDYLLSIATEQ